MRPTAISIAIDCDGSSEALPKKQLFVSSLWWAAHSETMIYSKQSRQMHNTMKRRWAKWAVSVWVADSTGVIKSDLWMNNTCTISDQASRRNSQFHLKSLEMEASVWCKVDLVFSFWIPNKTTLDWLALIFSQISWDLAFERIRFASIVMEIDMSHSSRWKFDLPALEWRR